MTPTPTQYHKTAAVLKVSSREDSRYEDQIPCTFTKMQGNRLILESSTKLNVSTVVSVEYEDTLFLGEVVGLNSVPAGYAICIFVKQALTGLQSLLTLRSQLGGEASPALVGKSPVLESANLH